LLNIENVPATGNLLDAAWIFEALGLLRRKFFHPPEMAQNTLAGPLYGD
jgi:hypothetical protein